MSRNQDKLRYEKALQEFHKYAPDLMRRSRQIYGTAKKKSLDTFSVMDANGLIPIKEEDARRILGEMGLLTAEEMNQH